MSSTFFTPSQQLLRRDGSTVLASDALHEATYVLVYFAASWCEPCCEFATLLKNFYNDHHTAKSFEVVLLSFDNSEAAMRDYFAAYHGDYYCLPFAEAKATRIQWMEEYNVKGLPTLVVFENSAAREVVTHYGCNMVVADPAGAFFPWPEADSMVTELEHDSSSAKRDHSTFPHAHLSGAAVGPVSVKTPSCLSKTDKHTFFDDPAQSLLRQDGSTVLASETLKAADYVLIYCSAHWCPYCREFTPLLKKFYEDNHEAKKFEIVFLSFDYTEEEMLDYFHEAHGNYYCLPFKDAEAMDQTWGDLYDIQYLPTLLVFENGFPRVMVTHDGREDVEGDPSAASFPWPEGRRKMVKLQDSSSAEKKYSRVPRAVSAATAGPVSVHVSSCLSKTDKHSFFDDPAQSLLRQDGSTVLASEALSGADYVLIYCSAHWCPPCRAFTPLLKKFYEDNHEAKKFEIVFLTFDLTEAEMLDYFHEAHGNYYCLPFADAETIKQTWKSTYDIKFIPTLLVFENGFPRVMVTHDGREDVEGDPSAASFPWEDAAWALEKVTESHSNPWSTCYAVPRRHFPWRAVRRFFACVVTVIFLFGAVGIWAGTY